MFRNDLQYDLGGFIGRTLSASCALQEGSPGYKSFIASLMELFEMYSQDGIVAMSNVTRSYIGRV